MVSPLPAIAPPKPALLTRDRNDDFVQMPFIATRRSSSAHFIGKRAPELARPLAHRFVAHANASGGQHLLDLTQAQGKSEVEPDRRADDFRREPMTAIERIA